MVIFCDFMLTVYSATRSGVTCVYVNVTQDNVLGIPNGVWVLLEYIQPPVVLKMGVQKALARVFKDEDYMKTHVVSVLRKQLVKHLEGLPEKYESVRVINVTLVHTAALAPILNAYLRPGSLEPQVVQDENGPQKKAAPDFTFTSIAEFEALPVAPALDVLVRTILW